MQKWIAGFALAFLSQSAFAFDSTAIDQQIQKYIDATDPAPGSGLAIAVIEDGKVAFEKGYGYRDRERKLPVTPETTFAIGSNSKAFTALALEMLQDEGKIDFQAPIRNYLPDFQLSDEKISAEATLIDLLSHRVGLPRHDMFWYLTPFSSDDLYARLRSLPFNADPTQGFRTSFQYNNLMYMVAGRLLAKLDGKPWEESIRDRVLKPLELSETGLSIDTLAKSGEPALAYNFDHLLPYKALPSVAPAGAINSTLRDMEKWISFYLRDGLTSDGRRIVSERALTEVESSFNDASSLLGVDMHYGLAWFNNPIDGEKVVWHGGNIDGFAAHVSFVPSRHLGLIILTNQNRGGVFEYPVVLPAANGGAGFQVLPWVLYHHLLNPGAPEVANPVPPKHFTPVAPVGVGSVPKLADFAHTYNDLGYGDLAVAIEGDHLTANYYGHSAPLIYFADLGSDNFSWDVPADGESNYFPVQFARKNGAVIGFSLPLEPNSKPIFFAVRND